MMQNVLSLLIAIGAGEAHLPYCGSLFPRKTTSMTGSPSIKPGNRLTILIFVILAAVVLLLMRVDWLTVGLGPYFPAYWTAVLVWFSRARVVLVIRRQRRWWVLVTALVVLYPAVMVGYFLIRVFGRKAWHFLSQPCCSAG